ncbi:YfhO family protein [Lacticaseibacillus daqingensis]|uniref:YfhO family protein n=1 Tax=Lacticaseibacillus daqingensis TaxID=2486014 RepID=UPI0013DE2E37|nr:YfhO family protein [Lacticaseibacillus daqingensis]
MRVIRFIQRHALWAAALTPVLIMAGYFIAIRVFPFGNNSLLTVDLGQQYIDFYSYWRQTVLGHPGQFFYAFNKDLGGDMLGTFAYYLMSPFNVILLLFPKTALDLAITVMTLAKYGAAGLGMGLYLRAHRAQGGWLIGLSTIYALSGWMIANQLNVMWLDAAAFLPLVALGVDRLIRRGRLAGYAIWLAVALISNYYMGYMICLFIIGYFGFRLVASRQRGRQRWVTIGRFAGGSLLAGALAAWLLLPTFFQLTQSKGTYTVTKITWKLAADPVKLLGKFFAGSFSFDQMPSGEANIFVGSVVLIGACLYFFNRQYCWQERLFAAGWTAFLFLSVMVDPLNLLWHAGQFPVWYPYRFSFVIVFWLVMLAWRELRPLPTGLSARQLIALLIVTLGLNGYVFLRATDYPYLSTEQIALTFLVSLASLVVLTVRADKRPMSGVLIALLLCFDAGSNAVVTLNQLAYVSHHDYHTYTETLRAGVTKLTPIVGADTRIGKTVLRTKNDAMQVGYFGTDQFTSLMEPAMPKFFGAIGQAAGDGFVAYTNGTLLTDGLLDIGGWLSPRLDNTSAAFLPQVSARPDLLRYDKVGQTQSLALYRNPYTVGLGFEASQQILGTVLNEDMPTANLERLMAGLFGTPVTNYFSVMELSAPTLTGVKQTGDVITKSLGKTHTVSYSFTADTTDPIYLQIGANFTDGLVSLSQDGHVIPIYDTFRDNLLLNVTPSQPGKPTTLTFTLNKDSADFGNLQLFELDQAKAISALYSLKHKSWHIKSRGDRSLVATIDMVSNYDLVMTTIPAAPGWHAKVDGQPVKTQLAAETFLAIPVKEGHHTIQLTYTPPYFWLGVLLSSLTAALALPLWLRRPTGRHTAPRRQIRH